MKFYDVPIPKSPYYKGKKFMDDLCSVAINGIPAYADSRRDPRVIGTVAWENFWKEELWKIYNGVDAGGHHIPGRYYYYLNYNYMSTAKGVITPDMCDLHLELAYVLDYCIENGHNLLLPKARRRGISEALHKMAVDYGWRFSIFKPGVISAGFHAGVAAGDKKYTDGFLAKWRYGASILPPELGVKAQLSDNDDEIIAGYHIKNENGYFEKQGTFNTIWARTAGAKSNIYKGEYLNVCISEEIGEHENWFDFYSDTKDCFKVGEEQVGIMIALGTGGKVDKGSKDFKRISEKAEEYNFIEFLITGRRFYYFGASTHPNSLPGNPTTALPPDSQLYDKYKPYQLIGVEDQQLAEKRILLRRKELEKAGDREEYLKELQNNPLNKQEIFRKTNLNDFNSEKMQAQSDAIDLLAMPKYSRYILEWERDEKGMTKIPFKVKLKVATISDPDTSVVYILDAMVGLFGDLDRYQSLFVAGIDSYNLDTSTTSKSLGAMVVLLRANKFITTIEGKSPVALIRTRPPRKEKFYEMCLQLTVLFGKHLIGNVLGDIRSAEICQWWKDWGGEKYLAKRPAKFEAEDTTQTTDYWFSLNRRSRPEMIGVMQTYIEDHIHNCWFKKIIEECQDFDVAATESDNDAADALGIALIQDISCELKPKDNTDNKQDDRFTMPQFEYNASGRFNNDRRKKRPPRPGRRSCRIRNAPVNTTC
jgi:hypothetical protein